MVPVSAMSTVYHGLNLELRSAARTPKPKVPKAIDRMITEFKL